MPARVDTAQVGNRTPRLRATGLVKRFLHNTVLKGVDLDVHSGEMLGLVGANGAGKSTLVKIVCGALLPDAGEVFIDGKPCVLHSVPDALAAGVAVAHQQVSIIPCLTGAENIMLGREIRRGGLIAAHSCMREAQALAASFGVTIDLSIECSRLSIGQHKILDILKALAQKPKILILDEPTASLTLSESRQLFTFLDELKAQGLAIVLITHHLREITQHCDSVVVLKDGAKIHDGPTADVTLQEVARLMVGRALAQESTARNVRFGDVAVAVQGLRLPGLHVPDLEVRWGEIVGVAGVLGAGQTMLLERLAGAGHPAEVSAARVGSLGHLPKTVAEAVGHGVYLIPDNRALKSMLRPLSIADNLVAGSLSLFSHYGFFKERACNAESGEVIQQLGIKCQSYDQPSMELSGGNQQKVVFGRWVMRMTGLGSSARQTVFLLDNPTEGVDVGAKAEIYALIRRYADDGAAVLISSVEFPELVSLCDRVYCISHGAVSACVDRSSLSEDLLMVRVN